MQNILWEEIYFHFFKYENMYKISNSIHSFSQKKTCSIHTYLFAKEDLKLKLLQNFRNFTFSLQYLWLVRGVCWDLFNQNTRLYIVVGIRWKYTVNASLDNTHSQLIKQFYQSQPYRKAKTESIFIMLTTTMEPSFDYVLIGSRRSVGLVAISEDYM